MNILYEDNHIIVAVKPPGILSQSDGKGGEDMLTKIKKYVREKYAKPGEAYIGLVHRLDRPAGGLMVFARTSKAASRLSNELREGGFAKRYLAVLTGVPQKLSGTLEDNIVKDRIKNISFISEESDGARAAKLQYVIHETVEGFSLAGIKLGTGRSHQIRVQFSAIGHPLAGDRKYGGGEAHHTTALWACGLEFTHPVTKARLGFVSIPENRGIWKKFNCEAYLNG